MRTVIVAGLLTLAFSISILGNACASAARTQKNSVVVAVATADGNAPNKEQLSLILRALEPELQRAGFQIAIPPAAAEFMLTVRFSADVSGNGGRATITSFERQNKVSAKEREEDARELRIRLREIEQWSIDQSRRID